MQSKKITSLHNPQIKKLIQLRESKNRRTYGQTIVEGAREVLRAFEAGIIFEEAFICSDLYKNYEDKNLTKKLQAVPQLFEVSSEIFEKISFGDRAEGILGVCSIPRTSLDDLKVDSTAMLMVVESVEKPGNLGAILRTAEASGVQSIILCDGATDIYNPNVIRASLGSVFLIPVVQASKEETITFLKKRRVKICATFVESEKIYFQEDLRPPIAFVLGSEQRGLSPFWSEQAELKIKIPMRGLTDSLNVSVCAAIIVYESIRQQTQSKK